MKITDTRRRALASARAGRLLKVHHRWRRRGVTVVGYEDRTVAPMVRAGLLAEVCGTLEITEAGRALLASLEGR